MANTIILNRGFTVNIEHGTATIPAVFSTPNPFAAPGATAELDRSIELPLPLPFTADDVLSMVRGAFPQADSVEWRPLPVVVTEVEA
jgi:hypothetical protein